MVIKYFFHNYVVTSDMTRNVKIANRYEKYNVMPETTQARTTLKLNGNHIWIISAKSESTELETGVIINEIA